MADLTEHLKLEIVTRIAQFERYASIAAQVSAEHGIQVDRGQVRAYDPTASKYCAGEKWRTIFEAARDTFLHDVSSIPIANQAYRLKLLQGLADEAREGGDAKGLREALKLAAKEVGGALTNQRSVSIEGRGRARDLTPAEREEAMFAIVDEAMAKRAIGKGTSSVQ